MAHLTFVTEPSERAIIRWVMRARGKDQYNRIFTYQLFPFGLSFLCFDGERLHRYTWRKKELPDVPVLGSAWDIPEMKGLEGVDTLSLKRDDEKAYPVLQFHGLIGKAQNAVAAATLNDGEPFREAALTICAHTGYAKQKYVLLDLHGGTLVSEGMIQRFETNEVDGEDLTVAIDPKFLKDALPYAPKSKKKTTPFFIAVTDKTVMLDNGYQMAIIAQKIFVPEEEKSDG